MKQQPEMKVIFIPGPHFETARKGAIASLVDITKKKLAQGNVPAVRQA